MRDIRERPPNYAKILKAFPGASTKGVIFRYGDAIYNPSGTPLTRSLIKHEEVHAEQQVRIGVEEWWDRYCADPVFRFAQELPAHIAEYKAYRPGRHGMSRAGHLHAIATRLSSPLYGGLVEYDWAAQRILEAA